MQHKIKLPDKTLPEINTFIGIDPGSQGGIAVIQGKQVITEKMGEFLELVNFFKAFNPETSLVFVEKVNAWGSDASIPGKSVRIAKMVMGYQQILDALAITGLHCVEVSSYSWQKQLKVWKKSEGKNDKKRRFKVIADEIFAKASVKATLWNADALLIANYCHMVYHQDGKKLRKMLDK